MDNDEAETIEQSNNQRVEVDKLAHFRTSEQHEFSLTISRLKEHIPRAWLECMNEFAKEMLDVDDAAAFCLERGGKAENLHIQAMLRLKWNTNKAALDYLKKLIKDALGIRYGDGMRWYVISYISNDALIIVRTSNSFQLLTY